MVNIAVTQYIIVIIIITIIVIVAVVVIIYLFILFAAQTIRYITISITQYLITFYWVCYY